MPQRKSGIKELGKNRRNKMRNLDVKTSLKKTLKQFATTVEEKKASDAQEQLKTVYKKLDKAAKRNLISKNTASRRKSRLTKQLQKIS
ncbi:MAG: 30S ribosomal protein S20 [Candidatus Omnitrophica bacterium]|nr:30S ribosomal protein S20 [Candidatus Omnitrophota bacterium]